MSRVGGWVVSRGRSASLPKSQQIRLKAYKLMRSAMGGERRLKS